MARAGTAFIDFEGRFDHLLRGSQQVADQAGAAWERQGRNALGQFQGFTETAGGLLVRHADGWGRTISDKLSGAGRVLGQSLIAGAAVGGAAVAGVGTAALIAGANYNQMGQRATAAFKTVTSSADAARQMMGSLMEFASASPFPRQVFVEATQQMLAFGFEAGNVIPTLSAVQDAVAAAGGSSQQISEVVFVLSQIQAAGRITGQDLMQLGQRGIDAARLIGQSLSMSS